jgi:hypothetical protein
MVVDLRAGLEGSRDAGKEERTKESLHEIALVL